MFPNMVRGVTGLRYSANHNAPDSWPIRARLTSQNDELCKNRHVSGRRSNNNVQYVQNNVYLNHVNIAPNTQTIVIFTIVI